MEMSEKQCIYCAKKIIGRTDKKFCNCYCRSGFHNIQNGTANNNIRRINLLLQKNRRILAHIYAVFPRKKTVPINTLYLQGFNLAHFTHQQKHIKFGTYTCCYDYGYKIIGKYEVEVIQL
ncbi:MAG: hypothetical protein EAZ13_08730 [Sphingobacteriia bacterium]|jgi:hypothetical protein|nr:MAG: hypothetical protein EAZ41_00065 [Sphingobacteriia bacterium]TAG29377.1 MAG: hypothetical protein EAZ35_11045 [Sphingobacteriia bacterium]TAH06650.1 MAG: hypothetical protein EAZ13_08730 [Sphingobacteriia bacterium]